MSESFLEVLNGDVDAIFEADNVVLPGGVLAQVRQFLKVGYDLAGSLEQTAPPRDYVPDFSVRGLGLELEKDDMNDHGGCRNQESTGSVNPGQGPPGWVPPRADYVTVILPR